MATDVIVTVVITAAILTFTFIIICNNNKRFFVIYLFCMQHECCYFDALKQTTRDQRCNEQLTVMQVQDQLKGFVFLNKWTTVNSLLSPPPGAYLFQAHLRGGGLS